MSAFLSSRIRAGIRKATLTRSKPIPIVVQSKFLMEEAGQLYELADFVKAWVTSADSKSTTLTPTWRDQRVSFYDNLTALKSHLSILGSISKVALTWKRPKKGSSYLIMTWTLTVSAKERDPLDKIKLLNEASGANGKLCCMFAEGEGHQQEIAEAAPTMTRRKPSEFDAICSEILTMIDERGEYWIEMVEEMRSVEHLPGAKARGKLSRALSQLLKDDKIVECEKRKSPRDEAKGRKVSVFKKTLDA